MAIILPADKKMPLTVVWRDKKRNIAPVDGLPVWTSSNPAIAEVKIDPVDSILKAFGGTIGLAQITVTADADLGEGFKPVTAIGDFEVVAGGASIGEIQPGTLEDQI